jgi:hypothetical protein
MNVLDKLSDAMQGHEVNDLIPALTTLLCIVARANCEDKKLVLSFIADSLDRVYGEQK